MMTSQPPSAVKERRHALVTGGAVRVGRTIALTLAGSGMDVAIGYHRSAGAARRTVREIQRLGVRGLAVPADLADPRAARRLVEAAARGLGGLDVLVNNAAVFFRTPFGSVSPAQYDAVLDVNLRGAFFCTQAAARVMGRHGGHIVNIGDAATHSSWSGYLPYALSKAGMVALTRGLARALRARRIAVNCVAPGTVLRPARLSRARWRAITRGREGKVTDVAAAVLFFATCPPDVTGQVLRVDGGAHP